MTTLALERLAERVRNAFSDRSRLSEDLYRGAVLETIRALDSGAIRVAERSPDGWVVHAWVKEAILLYFVLSEMQTIEIGPFEYHDKIPLKHHFSALGVRVVPPATVRFGAFIERGAILMPSYVNIGAFVGANTMIDTWATVGSCAQIGANVHLSGGVGIGGVLEPPSATPVIIEDGAFIGSRCILVEGVLVEEDAVLGANVTITSSTPIIDVRGSTPQVLRGRVPRRSVVIPGTTSKRFPAGEYQVPCALIIGERTASTDRKTSLNETLRTFQLSV